MSDTNQEKLLTGLDKEKKQVLDYTARTKFADMFNTLLVANQSYNPDDTLNAISTYVDNYDEFNIVYYSVISNTIFFDERFKKEDFYSNIESFLSKVSNSYRVMKERNDSEIDKMAVIYRFAIKMFEHVSLAATQVDKISGSIIIETEKAVQETKKEVNTTLKEQSDKDKEEIKKYYKGLEKDSITIMGMFVAIVLAFTGSVIIPTNLVNNAANIEPAKLVLLLSGVAFIFINLLYQLIRFLLIINEKSESITKLYDISVVNVILIIVFAVSLYCL
ncbi:MAG TPA: hypothetical protein H9804_03800 [Candidatus Mucispirillum faecigallinarum]|uniref:Uncharacterized protein n=1 Tax=Candidatus Mucispirillum faecigallinarum TaxID=2838699 RepID=A0A9D2KAS5_9BACT|nr:hypothetical protein [Candidatus Mucispirillum faecigallinarum]